MSNGVRAQWPRWRRFHDVCHGRVDVRGRGRAPRRLARRRGAHIMTYLARVLSLPHMRLVNVYISRPARLVCLRVGVPLIGGRRLQEKYFEPLPPPAVEAAKEGKSE
jgi:hypothetical protein